MTLLHVDPNDLVVTKVDMGKILFLKRHLDAFLTLYEEQGKAFWLRYIISFRDIMYKHHFSDLKSSMPLCKHKVSHISDEAFITLHREFIECTKPKKVKSSVWDMMIVVIYYMQYPTLHGNNPFQQAETKSPFARFFGCTTISTIQRQIMDGLIAPVFICFTSNLHALLERWMKEKKNPNNAKSFKWFHPPEWTKSKFIPSKFEIYIACYYGNTLEKELDVEANIRVLNYQNRPEKPRTPFDEKKYGLLDFDCDCEVKKCEDRVPFKKYVFNEKQYKCNHKKEDFKNFDYLEVLDPDIEDSIDISCPVCTEEAKKTILFKLAEDRFRREEMLEETLTHPKTTSRKKKGRKKSKCAQPAKLSEFCDKSDSISECEGAVGGFVSSELFVANQVIQKCKEKGFTEDKLKLIKDNIDKIEQSVKEKGSLDTNHLNLMLETGAILKSSEKTRAKSKISTTKETAESKKTSKSKVNSKKVQIEPIPTSAETKSMKESTNLPGVSFRSCSNCHKVKDEGVKLKKCALCFKENVSKIRYYCSRECQADDWVKCHKTEHDKGMA